MNLIKECDRYVEFSIQNLRSGIEDYFWVRKKVAEVVLTSSFMMLDALQNNNFIIWLISSYLGLLIVRYGTSDWPESKSSGEVKQLNYDIEFLKGFRFAVVVWANIFSLSTSEQIDVMIFLAYLIKKLHDDDDRGIKNWVKWQLKKLSSSIKIPEAQPLPV